MKLIIPFFLLLLTLSSCSGGSLGSQGEPVLLPTPYTGSMTANTNTFIENGLPTPGTATSQETAGFQLSLTASKDLSSASTGEFLTPLFNPVGMDAGMVSIDFHEADTRVIGNITTLIASFTIALNDGISKVRAENMQIIFFPVSPDEAVPFPDTAPNTTPVIGTGVGWGVVTEGTGIFANAIADGCSLNYRFLSESQVFSDGSFEPVAVNHCECVVNCP